LVLVKQVFELYEVELSEVELSDVELSDFHCIMISNSPQYKVDRLDSFIEL